MPVQDLTDQLRKVTITYGNNQTVEIKPGDAQWGLLVGEEEYDFARDEVTYELRVKFKRSSDDLL